MATALIGPVFTGGFEVIQAGEGNTMYRILYLPDKNNDQRRREGLAQAYYWMPDQVRIARRGDTGDYKFHLIHFEGVRSGDTHVGVNGTQEVAGGVLSLTTTMSPPLSILQQANNQLIARLRADDRPYWSLGQPAPHISPIPISSSTSLLSNLAPNSQGELPTEMPTTGGTGGAPGGAPGVPGAPRSRFALSVPTMPRTIQPRELNSRSNLDAWFVNLNGQGPSGIDPAAEKAYSAFLGSLPTAILWQGFHGAYSTVSVTNSMQIKVWSQNLHIKITGNWDRVFEHFSAAAQGRYWWFSADVKAEFNNLRINGGIQVELTIDGTTPQGEALREAANKRIDLILTKFMEEATKRIFEPAPPDVKPAEAGNGGGLLSGLFGFGGGFALKYRRDEQHLNLNYEETVNERYLMQHVVSSTLDGFYNEIKADPANERKYFTTLYLDDWERKVTRIVKSIVNWPNPAQRWVGEPVAYLGVQVGYPSTNGTVQWAGHLFQSTDPADATWQPAMAMKNAGDVVNAPAGWTPDKTFIKRSVHLQEPPGETDNPFMRVFVERNTIELDPGENGTLTNDINIEVRADSAGKFELGPVALNVDLESAKQLVELEMQALGRTLDGAERPIVRFTYKYEDQSQPRFFEIFTGDLKFTPRYRYRCHVVVKGSIFSKGQEWWGPWVEGAGNGALMVSVPTPDEAVTTRRLTARQIAGIDPILSEPASTTPGMPPVPVSNNGQGGVGVPPSSNGQSGVGAPPMTDRTAPAYGTPIVSGYDLTERTMPNINPIPNLPVITLPASSQRANDELALIDGWAVR